jgi:hypothetical protein
MTVGTRRTYCSPQLLESADLTHPKSFRGPENADRRAPSPLYFIFSLLLGNLDER